MSKSGIFLGALMFTFLAYADDVAFLYALDADVRSFGMQAEELGQPLCVGSRSIRRFHLGQHRVYAVKMGSGAVDTATSAEALFARFRCDMAFSLGPAGALSTQFTTGSWHRVRSVVAWQRGTSHPAGFLAAKSSRWRFDWDRLPVTPLTGVLQTTSDIAIASGETFIAATTERDRLQARTQADAVDMNSFGLAVVCQDHHVPLFIWRVISDFADENASATFRRFVSSYSGEGGERLAKWISRLPVSRASPSAYPAIRGVLDTPP